MTKEAATKPRALNCAHAVTLSLASPRHPDTNGWHERHRRAWLAPARVGGSHRVANMERATRDLLLSLATYADDWREHHARGIGEDGYAAAYWLDLARAARKLLSADIGRLDGGTLDALLFEMGELAGFTREELERVL